MVRHLKSSPSTTTDESIDCLKSTSTSLTSTSSGGNRKLYSQARADNTGVRVQGLGAKVESNFKEPPALRAFVDPVTGYTKYAFAYSDPFEVPADFHGDLRRISTTMTARTAVTFMLRQILVASEMHERCRLEDTDKGTLVLTNGNTSDGRLLVPNTFGELEVGGQSFVLNDNAAIGGDTAVDGVPVDPNANCRHQRTGRQWAEHQPRCSDSKVWEPKWLLSAADINIYGDAGGIPSDVINSIIENVADVTPAAGRDRIADFDNDVMPSDFIADNDLNSDGVADDTNPLTSGRPDQLLQEAGATSDDMHRRRWTLYTAVKIRASSIKGLGAKVQATLTPEQTASAFSGRMPQIRWPRTNLERPVKKRSFLPSIGMGAGGSDVN